MRLLRRDDWQHLVLEVSQEGEHLQRIVEQLRLPPFDQHLQLVAMIRALPAHAHPCPDSADAADTADTADTAHAAGLALPVARVRATEAEHAGWASHVFIDGQWRYHDPLTLPAHTEPVPDVSGIRSPAPDAFRTPPETPWHLVHTWHPVAGVPTRQEVLEALQTLVCVPGVQALQAVLQTGRSGYDCRYVAGGETAEGCSGKTTNPAAIEPVQANLSTALRLQETVWRLDNRVCLGLAQGTDLAGLQRAMAALEALWS